jgi:hypothetical protein
MKFPWLKLFLFLSFFCPALGQNNLPAASRLIIRTVPDQAQIVINDRLAGQTPASLADQKGCLNIRLWKLMFQSFDTTITVKPGEQITLDVALRSVCEFFVSDHERSESIKITSISREDCLVDGELIASNPCAVQIAIWADVPSGWELRKILRPNYDIGLADGKWYWCWKQTPAWNKLFLAIIDSSFHQTAENVVISDPRAMVKVMAVTQYP